MPLKEVKIKDCYRDAKIWQAKWGSKVLMGARAMRDPR